MSKAQFAALKRKARAVRARPKRKTGRGGQAVAPQGEAPMPSLPRQTIPKKEPVTLPLDTSFANSEQVASSAPLEPSALWRSHGELEVLIYCRPLNPRLLLIRTDDGHNGRVAVKPELQLRFGTGKRIWVKPTTKPGFYELVGKYTQWGSRCIS
jgi:hypothetical protein